MTTCGRFRIILQHFAVCCAFLLLLTACNEKEIVQDLNQKQAQEIVTALAEQGIDANVNKGKGAQAKFSVAVAERNFTEAVAILHYNSLPKVQEPGLNDILESRGFLPNSKELESLRIERALAAELESMIRVLPTVQEVKAVVRRAAFSGMGPPAPTQLSVLITSTNPSEINTESLRSLIMNLVQGVTEQSMVIDIQQARQLASTDRQGIMRAEGGQKIAVPIRSFLGWFRIAADDYDRLIFLLSVVLSVFLLLGVILGFMFGFLGRKVVSSRAEENFIALRSEKPTLSLSGGEQE